MTDDKKPCDNYKPDHNGECLNCDEPLEAHSSYVSTELGKYEVSNKTIEDLMTQLSMAIQTQLPEGWRFSLFLFQKFYDDDGEDKANIFYSASAKTHEILPLMQEWMRRQVQ